MTWHDENPWRKRHKKQAETPEQRIDEIVRRCQAGDISLTDAIKAAYAVGVAYEQARLVPGANSVKENA